MMMMTFKNPKQEGVTCVKLVCRLCGIQCYNETGLPSASCIFPYMSDDVTETEPVIMTHALEMSTQTIYIFEPLLFSHFIKVISIHPHCYFFNSPDMQNHYYFC